VTHHRKPKGWAAVPGPARAPILGILVLVLVYAGLLVGAVGAIFTFVALLFS
jgi:hypothetical protein